MYCRAFDGAAPPLWQTKLHAFLRSLQPPDAGVDALILSDDGDVKVTDPRNPDPMMYLGAAFRAPAWHRRRTTLFVDKETMSLR